MRPEDEEAGSQQAFPHSHWGRGHDVVPSYSFSFFSTLPVVVVVVMVFVVVVTVIVIAVMMVIMREYGGSNGL